MYPPLYDKMRVLLSTRWYYPHKNAKKRDKMLKTKQAFRDIDNLVRDVGLAAALLTERQKARIEEVYANYEKEGVVR